MGDIDFFIPARVYAKQGCRGQSGKRRFQPKYVQQNAALLKYHAANHAPGKPLRVPLRVEYVVWTEWPKRTAAKVRCNGSQPRPCTPDAENVAKQLNDVLESAGFFQDDKQITTLVVRKRWGEQTGVEVRISRDY